MIKVEISKTPVIIKGEEETPAEGESLEIGTQDSTDELSSACVYFSPLPMSGTRWNLLKFRCCRISVGHGMAWAEVAFHAY